MAVRVKSGSSPQLNRNYCSSTQSQAKTFSNQNSMPSLPVPNLRESCDKYLQTIVPIAHRLGGETQLAQTKQYVEDFLKQGGDGERLQQKLVQRGKERRNWLEDWWLHYAYCAWPDPIPINSNYYFLFDEEVAKPGSSQTLSAAKYISGILQFKNLLDNEQIPPEKMQKTINLDMHQFSKIFSTVRIPGQKADTNRTFTPTSKVVVISNKQFYVIDVAPNGKNLSTTEIEAQLRKIVEDSKNSAAPANGMGAFTAWDRPAWANYRDQLLKLDPKNGMNLDTIETSLMVLSLDPSSPTTSEEAGRRILGGDANNRWFDKLIQVVVFANGRAGFNGEHSPLDAVATQTMCDIMFDFAAKDSSVADANASKSASGPQKLVWTTSSDISKALADTDKAYTKFYNDIDYTVLRYNGYGSNWIKTVAQMSPDSWVQMGLQLAFYRLYGKSVATYETAQTRQFYHGRTETCRSLSIESAAFTKAMVSPSTPKEEKLSALKKAVDSHKKYMSEAVAGKGIDRHFLGLRLLANEEIAKDSSKTMPSIFADPVYKDSITWRISTSNITSKNMVCGFGPVVEDGYGICYGTRKDLITFSITSRLSNPFTNSNKMKEAITQSLTDMQSLFEGVAPKAKL